MRSSNFVSTLLTHCFLSTTISTPELYSKLSVMSVLLKNLIHKTVLKVPRKIIKLKQSGKLSTPLEKQTPKNTRSVTECKLLHEGTDVRDPLRVAEIFNNYFVNIAQETPLPSLSTSKTTSVICSLYLPCLFYL